MTTQTTCICELKCPRVPEPGMWTLGRVPKSRPPKSRVINWDLSRGFALWPALVRLFSSGSLDFLSTEEREAIGKAVEGKNTTAALPGVKSFNCENCCAFSLFSTSGVVAAVISVDFQLRQMSTAETLPVCPETWAEFRITAIKVDLTKCGR